MSKNNKEDSNYDKNVINDMEKKGLFDNAYDSLVLKQSDEDRKKLQASLEKDKEKLEEKLEEKPIGQVQEKPKQRKPKKKQLSWIEEIINFFKQLFFGKKGISSTKFLRKREIKTLIEDFNPLFYDFRVRKVRITFPEYVYEIYNLLKELNELFEEVFIKEDDLDFSQPIFFLEFVDNLLHEDERILLDSINEDYFYKIVSDEDNPEEILSQKLKELKDRIEQFSQQAITHYTSYFEMLISLSQFNFYELFKIFDPRFKNSANYKPKFQALFNKTDTTFIKQLASYFSIVDFDIIPENILMHFDHVLSALKTKLDMEISSEEGEKHIDKKTAKLIAKLKNANRNTIINLHYKINHLNKKKIIEALIKVITDDYDYEAKVISKREGLFLKRYIKLTLEKKQFLYKKSLEKIRSTIIQNDILSFFGVNNEQALLYINNYTSEISEKLKEKGLEGFNYVKVVSIYKTFYENMYQMEIRKSINTLLVEGDFLNKREQSIFSEAYYTLDSVMDLFIALDTEISEGSHDIGQIIKYALGEISDKAFHIVVQRKLSNVETRLREILKDGCNQYKLILDNLNYVLDDWKRTKPKYITNIRTIGGSGNKAFSKGLVKAVDNIDKFLNLIYHFPVMGS